MNSLIISIVIYVALFSIQSAFSAYYSSEGYAERKGLSALKRAGVDPLDMEAVKAYMIKQYDPDRFLNRLADFVGWIWQGISWISSIIVLCVYVYALYTHFTSDNVYQIESTNDMFLGCAFWSVFMYLFGIFVSLCCKLVTNRNPKEPHNGRKIIEKSF